MEDVTKEVNLIASEIVKEMSSIQGMLEGIGESVIRGQRLEKGFNYLRFEALKYCFIRFYKFADFSLLSKEAKKLKTEVEAQTLKDIPSSKETDIPKELQDFLNSK